MEKNNVQTTELEIFHLGGGGQNSSFFFQRDDTSVTVDAVEDALQPLQLFVDEHLERCGCDKRIRLDIRLAVEEIFVNICTYAYPAMEGTTRITCEVVEDTSFIQLIFSDSGIPFDPLKKKADTSEQHFVKHEGGYGIHLVQNMMDEVTYEYRDGKNILKVKRFLA